MPQENVSYSYDLAKITSIGKVTIDLKNVNELIPITFEEDSEGQVVFEENGKNILITAYKMRNDVYTMVETVEKEGSNKFIQTTYKYDTQKGDWVEQRHKTVSTSAETEYYKNGVLLDDDPGEYDTTSPDPKKTFGTITIKNGNLVKENGAVSLSGDSFTTVDNLLAYNFEAVHKGNKFTGTFYNEHANSTEKNETFNLGTGEDSVLFTDNDGDMISFGTDNVILNDKETVSLSFGHKGDATDFDYSYNANDATITATTEHEMNYYKLVTTVKKITQGEDSGKYHVTQTLYNVNETWTGFETDGEDITDEILSAAEVKESNFKNQTLYYTITDGESSYSTKKIKEFDEKTYTTDSVTIKNYMKLANSEAVTTDITLGEEEAASLYDLLQTVASQGSSEKDVKQKLTGTFLDEHFFTAKKNDTVTTGSGEDTIYSSAGKDTITLDGNGSKTFDASDLTGDTTIKFAKGALGTTSGELEIPGADLEISNIGDFKLYTKSGNNLVIQSQAEIDNDSFVDTSITVTDYFKNEYIANHTTVDESLLDFESNEENANHLTVYQNTAKQTGSAYNDDIYAQSKTKTIAAGEGNNIINQYVTQGSEKAKALTVTAGSGNDTYYLNDFDGTVDITDLGGVDKLIITAGGEELEFGTNNLTAIFNVMAKDKTAKAKDDINTLKFISVDFNSDNKSPKDSIKYLANIHNYFENDANHDYTAGTGRIETISIGSAPDADVFNAESLATIKAAVVQWLEDNSGKGYTSAFDVVNKGNGEDMLALLQVYQENYTPIDNNL